MLPNIISFESPNKPQYKVNVITDLAIQHFFIETTFSIKVSSELCTKRVSNFELFLKVKCVVRSELNRAIAETVKTIKSIIK